VFISDIPVSVTCAKIVYGHGFAPNPTEDFATIPDPLAVLGTEEYSLHWESGRILGLYPRSNSTAPWPSLSCLRVWYYTVFDLCPVTASGAYRPPPYTNTCLDRSLSYVTVYPNIKIFNS